jgi:glycosyltransferase involved in cell wall biosynthesis
MIYKHPGRITHEEWYPQGTPVLTSRPFKGADVEKFLRSVDVVLFFETPFDWSFADRCRAKGIKTVLMPMYEWFPTNPSHHFDKYLCPSLLDVNYFPGQPFLVPPVDPGTWRQRARAKRFLHNSGNIGHRNHKGTVELLQAIPFLRPEIQLTIRSQQVEGFKRLRAQYPSSHPGVTFELENVEYSKLFDDYDVLVAPEKFNGLSLPLQEAFAAGLLVITTDRFPMSTWLPTAPLIPVERYSQARVGSGYNAFDEAEVSPAKIAATMNAWYDQDITEYSLAGREWANQHSWAALRDSFLQELAL